MSAELTIAMCDVCWYVDGDQRQYPCHYCSRCDAYICDRCLPNTRRRALAMIKKKIARFLHAL